eukprot:TRINITY_DN10465_c0_g1_i3.p1 TRINITY_DN10465_c0_g1~~TRINITY_DN10465_c0_g1_i3.p1  ORF type:complete len:180 (+),score=43.78 TRINITY_DN10465_c0_g1_i3:64-603(+)
MCIRDRLKRRGPKKEYVTGPSEPTEKLRAKVVAYLSDAEEEMEVRNLHDAQDCFRLMKEVYNLRMQEYVEELTVISEKLRKYDDYISSRQKMNAKSDMRGSMGSPTNGRYNNREETEARETREAYKFVSRQHEEAGGSPGRYGSVRRPNRPLDKENSEMSHQRRPSPARRVTFAALGAK